MINNLLLNALFWVLIVDITLFPQTIKKVLYRFIKGKNEPYRDYELKPFDCSLCCTWWAGLFYILFTTGFNFELIVFNLLIACLTPTIKSVFILINDIIISIIDAIYNIFLK